MRQDTRIQLIASIAQAAADDGAFGDGQGEDLRAGAVVQGRGPGLLKGGEDSLRGEGAVAEVAVFFSHCINDKYYM
jgi:hypothetical protein